jgi:triosephosphate isomerase (TIM)
MNKLLVANWKMNNVVLDCVRFMEEFVPKYSAKREAWIAPQALHFNLVKSMGEPKDIKAGVQNVSEQIFGAYTGEISPRTLQSMGGHFAIIGHSERRQFFGETSKTCAIKIRTSLRENLAAIYCVGETLAERESGQTLAIVGDQLLQGLTDIGTANSKNLIIAYEPVWAIGTGKTATPAQAQEVHAFIRKVLMERFPGLGDKLRILYGGSVKPDNVEELLSQKDIDGGLVGGASLKAKDFLALCGDK